MTYLLDTVAVSAMRLPRRNPSMAKWMSTKRTEELWISTLTLGEIQQGISVLADEPLRDQLEAWLHLLSERFADRILPFGTGEAILWGDLTGPRYRAGRSPATVDSMIAATAIFRDLAIVTRNVKDFARFNVPVINPWDDENGA